jgi:hypothetical protein
LDEENQKTPPSAKNAERESAQNWTVAEAKTKFNEMESCEIKFSEIKIEGRSEIGEIR